MRYDRWDDKVEYFVPIPEQASDLTLGIVGLNRASSRTLESLIENLYKFNEQPNRIVSAAEDLSKLVGLGILELGVRAVLYTVYWPVPSFYQILVNIARLNYPENNCCNEKI